MTERLCKIYRKLILYRKYKTEDGRIMKCVVLAFDALEYRFVQDFHLDNLKQKEYGKVIIPPECFVEVKTDYFQEATFEPQTPLVWFSFLTGELPSAIQFSPIRWKSQFLDVLSAKLANILPVKWALDRIRVKGKFARARRRSRIQDYNVPTIFDLTEKSYAFNVPLYTQNWWGWGYGMNPNDFNNFEDFIDAVLKKQIDKFNNQMNKTICFLEQNHNWNLFMAYFYVLDPYGELCLDHTKDLSRIYAKVDKFVKEIKRRLDESFVLIVSDHGIERLGRTRFGKHSNYAFYSANFPLHLDSPKITDFYPLIREVLTSNSRSLEKISECHVDKGKTKLSQTKVDEKRKKKSSLRERTQ